MSNQSTHDSKACCNTPVPVASLFYEPKGTYTTHANTRCYVTGSPSATKAIFHIYDIMGFRNPTLQGADILANAGYLVVMPDFFDGDVAQPEWLARDTEEKKQKMGAFMTKLGDPKPFLEKLEALVSELKTTYGSVEKWAAIGFCWGGKIVSLTSGGSSHWAVGIESSPARVDPEDAKKITIPLMMLASQGEPKEAVAAFEKELKTPHIVETFDHQIHGWMSARADLSNQEVKKEYERGYKMALDFIGTYM